MSGSRWNPPLPRITNHVVLSRGLPSTWAKVPDEHREHSDLPDLLVHFSELCQRDGTDIGQIASTKIWNSTWIPKVDKPRFADLYWKLALGKVVAGDYWLGIKAECPICNVTQLAEHLFWSCPVAQMMWKRLNCIWKTITGTTVPKFPTSWSQLLLTGVTMRRKVWGGATAQRRWRILFGETIWSLWLQKCRWSHEDLQFSRPAVLSLFKEAMLLRVGKDRLCARSTGKKGKKLVFHQTWGFDADFNTLPDWLC